MPIFRPLPLLLLVLTVVGLLASEQQTAPNADAGMIHIDHFAIDVYEFPNRKGTLPLVDVTWGQAQELCQAQGKRLCTENEWVRACRGPNNYVYGYGDVFEPHRCNTPYQEGENWQRGDLATSGQFDQCSNDYGVHDMIGNVWEWTDSWYDRAQGWRVVRGGSWFQNVNLARADGRYGRQLDAKFHLDLVGFRCCQSRPLPEE